MPDLLRRRLLLTMAVSPLLFQRSSAAAKPMLLRIVALEWLPVELLLALEVTPLAVAEIDNYRRWVGSALPAGTQDVGLRAEPNLELLVQLAPSLILYSTGYGPTPDRLARIAPVMGFSFMSAKNGPLENARDSLRRLAARIGREAQCQRHLAAFDRLLAETRQRLARRKAAALLLLSVLDSRHVLVFGKNSLFGDVMRHLGIANAWTGETSAWGSTIVGIERLATIKEADVLCFEHDNAQLMQQVTGTVLWQSMPFVRQQRVRRVPSVWFYGATLSAMQFCRTLVTALEV